MSPRDLDVAMPIDKPQLFAKDTLLVSPTVLPADPPDGRKSWWME